MAYHDGQLVGNSYRIIRTLGHGGFGTVYLGEHLDLKQQVAIKVLDRANQLTDGDITKFRKEAQTIASLVHPHIVRVQHFWVDDEMKVPFLVMDYAVNGTLRQRYPAGTVVPLKDIVSHVKQISNALEYAHQRKVIHRDIKPANLLLSYENSVLLSDFGLAITAHDTVSQEIVPLGGTLAYIAPEQYNGSPKPASDQYSLAVVVYEWICGVRPFNGSPPLLVAQHLNAAPPPLHEKIPSLYPALEDVVLKALSKDYKDRFETVEAFSDALERAFLAQEAIVWEIDNSNQMKVQSTSSTLQAPGKITPPGTLLHVYQTGYSDSYCKQALAWSFDSTMLACGDNRGVVQVWNIIEDKEVCKYQGHSHVTALLWSRDDKTVLSAGYEGTIQGWDIRTNRKIRTYKGHTDEVTSLALAPSGKYMASGSKDGTAIVWDIKTGKMHFTYEEHEEPVESISWSPNNTLIATADYGETVQVWDVSSKQEVFTSYYPAEIISWSPKGHCIGSANSDEKLQLWHPNTGIPIMSYDVKNPMKLCKVFTWSPDGTKIACVVKGQFAQNDNTSRMVGKTVHIWEVETGKCLFSYTGHSRQIEAIAWAPNGEYIASYSDDGVIHVWQAN